MNLPSAMRPHCSGLFLSLALIVCFVGAACAQSAVGGTPTNTPSPTPTANPELIYGVTTSDSLGTNPISLVRFHSSTPGTITTIGNFSNPFGYVRSIDFRPATGQLYAISSGFVTPLFCFLFTVDLTTGILTPVGGGFFIGTGTLPMEMEFDPVTDTIRLITADSGTSGHTNNFRIDPDTGNLLSTDTNLAFDTGDPRAGNGDFNMVGAAYSNNVPGANTTTLYSWDYQSDSLVTIGGPNGNPSPNGGRMFTINTPSNFLTNHEGIGMDISGTTGTLFVTHDDPESGTSMSLYTRSIVTGEETLLGAYPAETFVTDISVFIPARTGTPTATPTETPSVSGVITYGNAIGAPTPRFVSNVTVRGTGPSQIFTTTVFPNGDYTLSGFVPGNYTVAPSKTGGGNNITSFDAAKISQHVAGVSSLTGNQLIVADVSGNGVVSSFDAAQVAKYVVATTPFGTTGNWIFNPVNRTYASLTTNIAGEDYSALLMGEVSGNWTNSGARPVGSRQMDAAGESVVEVDGGPMRRTALIAPRLVTPANKEVVIPVGVDGMADKGIIAYEFDLRYDPAVITPLSDPVDLAGTLSSKLSVAVNGAEAGVLRVAVYGPLPISGRGVLLNLRFKAVGEPGSISPLIWENAMFNEGDPQATTNDGQIELSAATLSGFPYSSRPF